MAYILWLYVATILALNIGFPIFSVFMLNRFLKTFPPFEEELKRPLPHYPGVTVLTSLRGDTNPLENGLSSLMKQDYPGPLELIIAVENSGDPGYSKAKKILAEKLPQGTAHRMEVRWVTDFKPKGGNPRTAQLAYISKYARYDWIYWLALDTYSDADHLRKLMHKAEVNPDIYVSALPVHLGGNTPGALFENVPLVWEVLMAGLLNRAINKPFVYGGNILFHMNLLKKAGGFSSLLNYLTEEMPMSDLFSRAGGKSEIVPSLVWASHGTQRFSEFYCRKLRWAMIAKFHHRKLIASATLFNIMWMPIIFLFTGNPLFLYLMWVCLATKVVVVYLYHLLLKLPMRQARWSLLMVPYEFICFIYCIHALFQKRVNWSGVTMSVDSHGFVTREN
jgi:cellulose synthase/poly-beta-1,6-N-acetylglucosamine synthase-like glycosyltransferase